MNPDEPEICRRMNRAEQKRATLEDEQDYHQIVKQEEILHVRIQDKRRKIDGLKIHKIFLNNMKGWRKILENNWKKKTNKKNVIKPREGEYMKNSKNKI